MTSGWQRVLTKHYLICVGTDRGYTSRWHHFYIEGTPST